MSRSAAAATRVAIIGLDAAPPEFLFEDGRFDLPNLRALMNRGVHGCLASIVPPITVPAWMCMMTGRDPGSLGIYGFRNRRDHTYAPLSVVTSADVKAAPLWETLGAVGKQSVVLGLPLTYPPKPMAGNLVSCFMTPDTNRTFTHPADLGPEINGVADGYMPDVVGFRDLDRDELLAQLTTMMDKRFRVAEHLAKTKPWDLFAMVEMGSDRIQHAFWRYVDSGHRLHEPGHRFADAIPAYYRALDAHVGRLIDALGDDTTVLVVSDHGAKAMDGGICVNEWLIQNGYLVLKDTPAEPTRLTSEMVDWSRTRAWGEGGYYARLFLNVRGREPSGIVAPADVERVRDELIAGLERLGDAEGNPIGTRVHRPEELYTETRGIPPDLIGIFGELRWRSIGTVGGGEVHVFGNDTGPDDANHAENGIFIAAGPGIPADDKPKLGMNLLDIAPTVLELLGLDIPEAHGGKSLQGRFDSRGEFTEEDEEVIARRLEELGYL